MKTLYVSDLDGTLLNENAELSASSRDALNELSDSGASITIATARTAASVAKMLSGVRLGVPVILMNGAAIYSLGEQKYVRCSYLSETGERALLDMIASLGSAGFVYTVDGEGLHTFYETLSSVQAKKFVDERVDRYGKVFTKAPSLQDLAGRGIMYYSVEDRYETLLPAYERLCAEPSLNANFYADIYDKGYWYLEVSASGVSKKDAVLYLKRSLGFTRAVGFGDNINDLPLFEACDEAYAVKNAAERVKSAADGVIGANTENAVPIKIKQLERARLERKFADF